tara:strand:+ start:91 stop:834 length:744 start_codon:yes stop_codon:yes gene_type:complete
MQQKKIKGFTLLELMVVIIIIGLISAIGFLPFQSWRSDRLARAGAVSVSGVIQDIYSQVQRGHYSFSMFRVHSVTKNNETNWFISSYGMETENFTTLVRNKYKGTTLAEFHVFEKRCKTDLLFDSVNMWDDQGYPISSGDKASKKLTVSSYEIDDKLSIGVSGVDKLTEGTVCFSKDGSYYAAGGMFLSGTFGGGGDSAIVGGEPSIREEMYVCTAESGADSCSSSSENFYSITWSRFGNIDMQKLN